MVVADSVVGKKKCSCSAKYTELFEAREAGFDDGEQKE